MRCLNVNGGGGEQTFSETFTLDKGTCEDSSYSQGCGTFHFDWNSGCYGVNGRGNALSTSDLDRDTWAGGSCAATGNSAWADESAGWGWHGGCGCGAIYRADGQPMCMGKTGNSVGYTSNGADRVEMWLMLGV